MSIPYFFLIYAFFFILSFLALLNGGSGYLCIDIFLYILFFLLSYTGVLLLKIIDKQKFVFMILLITMLSSLYFFRLNLYYMVFNLFFIIKLFYFESKNGTFYGDESVFMNFVLNCSLINKVLILIFVLFIIANESFDSNFF